MEKSSADLFLHKGIAGIILFVENTANNGTEIQKYRTGIGLKGGYRDVAIFFYFVTYVTKIFDRIIMRKKYKARRQNVSGLFLCLEVRM